MPARRAAAIALAVTLVAAGCISVLNDEERAWCGEHPQEVVAASYTTASPMTLDEVLQQAAADDQSPEYLRACRRAFDGWPPPSTPAH
jgi:hypothetical protein